MVRSADVSRSLQSLKNLFPFYSVFPGKCMVVFYTENRRSAGHGLMPWQLLGISRQSVYANSMVCDTHWGDNAVASNVWIKQKIRTTSCREAVRIFHVCERAV